MEIDFRSWYLDDGAIGGDADHVHRLVSAFSEAGRGYGLLLNRSKCEVILAPSASAEVGQLFAEQATPKSWTDWSLLGVP
jgi:hypothetical protein